MKEVYLLKKSDRKGKRFVIIMDKMDHHFGAYPFKDGTFLEHKDLEKKKNWIKRHEKDKNWNNKHSSIYYSRHLLWGDFPDLKKNIKLLEKKDNIKIKVEL
tara:strand:+ start:79 stop:381 length:303 start_codon:yes stop_codon:yes gene_type:complete